MRQRNLRPDLKTLLDWAGIKSTEEIGVEGHEDWAHGFEQYCTEGRAPSLALKGIFEHFRAQLLAVYGKSNPAQCLATVYLMRNRGLN
jgi:hypothetical protein